MCSIEKYPEVSQLIRQIFKEVPLQRKRIDEFLRNVDDDYWDFAESLCRVIKSSGIGGNGESYDAAVKAYKDMCSEILREQIRFRRSRVYRSNDFDNVLREVYEQKDRMRAYLKGLLLTYLFWPNHYKMFRFFQRHIANLSPGIYLEVGSGHGLFTAEVLRLIPETRIISIDISRAAIEMTREMLTAFNIDSQGFEAFQADFLNSFNEGEKYDFIILGEVLEHVSDAPGFVAQAKRVLNQHGAIYLSTCVNAPAIDHIYNFSCVEEIGELIEMAGLDIVDSIILPADDTQPERWQEELTPINYAAVLRHRA